MSVLPTIALFARYPRAGAAKTRLVPLLGEAGAARVHRRLVERTLGVVQESGLPFVVWTTGADHGEFGDWLGSGVPLVEQGDGDLGARLARVPAPGIVLGADVPDLTPAYLLAAASALEAAPVVIGPAEDGGYYLLGFRTHLSFLWQNMPWGTDGVLAETLARLAEHDVAYRLLEPLADCDRPEDLDRWPELLP
ncbi:MAG: TIGR04282 family arsenosugar biosynthesis glycosyltransferase [Erythrobacter sp.]|nr:MAG: TIGR04282 family arsenosugar biosynthesis glycosyltransferase [Erythrobacter sp.]